MYFCLVKHLGRFKSRLLLINIKNDIFSIGIILGMIEAYAFMASHITQNTLK